MVYIEGDKVRYKKRLNKTKNEKWVNAEVHYVRKFDDGDTKMTLKNGEGGFLKLIDDGKDEVYYWRKLMRVDLYAVEPLEKETK